MKRSSTKSVARSPKAAPTVLEGLRLTIPAREALEAHNRVEATATAPGEPPRWCVTLVRPPPGLVLVALEGRALALRMADEPPYPGERAGDTAWWERGAWVPCPTCGAALAWYEAGYVPGYRVCLEGHHAQLAGDGLSAKAVAL